MSLYILLCKRGQLVFYTPSLRYLLRCLLQKALLQLSNPFGFFHLYSWNDLSFFFLRVGGSFLLIAIIFDDSRLQQIGLSVVRKKLDLFGLIWTLSFTQWAWMMYYFVFLDSVVKVLILLILIAFQSIHKIALFIVLLISLQSVH